MTTTIPLRNTVAIGMDGITQASWPDIGSDTGFIAGLYDTATRLSPKTNATLYQATGLNKLTEFNGAHLTTTTYAAAKWSGSLLSPNFANQPAPISSIMSGFINNSFVIGEFEYTNDAGIIAQGLASVRFAWINMPVNTLNAAPTIHGISFSADQTGAVSNTGFNWTYNPPKFSSTEIAMLTFSEAGGLLNFYGFIFDGNSFTAQYNLLQIPSFSTAIYYTDIKYQGGYDALIYQQGNNLIKSSFTPVPYTDGLGSFTSAFVEIDFQEADINDCMLGLTLWWPWFVTGYKQTAYAFGIINQMTSQFSLIVLDRNLSFYDRYIITGNDSLASQIILNMLTTSSSYFTITYDEAVDKFQVCANDNDTIGSAYPIQFGTFQLSAAVNNPRVLNKFNLGCVNYCINVLKQRKAK